MRRLLVSAEGGRPHADREYGVGAAVMGLDEPVGPEDAPWYRAFEREPDPRRALKILVENSALILRRVGPLTAAIHGAANDPEVAAVRVIGEQRRHEGYGEIVRFLAAKGGLRKGLTMARATDILLVLLSPDLFDALENGRGWSAVDCDRWVVEVPSQQLLPPGLGQAGLGLRASRTITVRRHQHGLWRSMFELPPWPGFV